MDWLPFLHALATNTAIGLYEDLGFRHRLAALFAVVRVPRPHTASLGGLDGPPGT